MSEYQPRTSQLVTIALGALVGAAIMNLAVQIEHGKQIEDLRTRLTALESKP